MASAKKKAAATVRKPAATNGKALIDVLVEPKDKAAEKCGGKGKGPKKGK